ncbi:hypothetical protein Scep_024591 [Stephania cephalantha]|uniref:Uncharacterized protein n=1 Tax=Stephania cephalantha TaxID=152367 RepID=A0AAP0HYE6_9MAGN
MDGDRLDLVTVAANLSLTRTRLWSLLRNGGSTARAVAVLRGPLRCLDQFFNLKEASSHCAKALDIHKAQLGDNSVEVAMTGVSLVSSIRASFYVDRSNVQAGGNPGAQTEKVLCPSSNDQAGRHSRTERFVIGDGGVHGVGET